jgi:hypothetical protein
MLARRGSRTGAVVGLLVLVTGGIALAYCGCVDDVYYDEWCSA